MTFSIGDLFRVTGAYFLYHYYVYVGPMGPDGQDLFHVDKRNGAELVHSSVLDSEIDVHLISRVSGQYSAAIQQRALQLIGLPYHETKLNCEQGANYVQSGNANSSQLNFIVGVGLTALAIHLLKRGRR